MPSASDATLIAGGRGTLDNGGGGNGKTSNCWFDEVNGKLIYSGRNFIVVDGVQSILPEPGSANYPYSASLLPSVRSVAYGNGVYVAVGGWANQILTDRENVGLSFILRSTELDAGTFVAVPNPIAGSPSAWGGVIFDDNLSLFIAWGTSGIYTSADGLTWIRRSSRYGIKGIPIVAKMRSVNGHLVMTGVRDLANNVRVDTAIVSTDGLTWSEIATFPNGGIDVAWNGDLYVTFRYHAVFTSPDLINWTERSLPPGVIGNGLYGDVDSTDNGISMMNALAALAAPAGGRFVLVGWDSFYPTPRMDIWTSP